MKTSRFSDAQKSFILKQVADICRRAGISQMACFDWKKKYDGMLPPDMRRLQQLDDVNSKLRKLVADLCHSGTEACGPCRDGGSLS